LKQKHLLPNPSSLWHKHVTLVLNVLWKALRELNATAELPKDEEELDRVLTLKAREAYFSLSLTERPQGFHLGPKTELSAFTEADLGEPFLRKKPDFTWGMQNDLAGSPEEVTKDFHIESKRLGKDPNGRLTREYVTKGVVRFLTSEHRYGNNVGDGAMVGYVQDSDVDDILTRVNRCAAGLASYHIPELRFDDRAEPVMQAAQTLNRTEVNPASFTLHHLWTELRGASRSA
jgi:hypothetical protein